MKKILSLVLVAVLALPVFALSAQDGTIVDVAAGNPDFSTLVAAVEAAGLTETLAGEGPFTVFAPTNAAFEALPAGVVDFLLANPDVLTEVLTYHVLPGAVLAADVTGMEPGEVETVQGGTVFVDGTGETPTVEDVNIVTTDIEASNGVIHVIEGVILPEIALPEPDYSVSGDIIAAGSSTVYPMTLAAAEQFTELAPGVNISVDSIGSGAGIERFCDAAESDIANSSRPIEEDEIAACEANGRTPVEFLVGIDPLPIVVSGENTFVESLTGEQVVQIFTGQATTWDQVDPSFPAEPIQVFSPGTDSGTFDFFVETVIEGVGGLDADAAIEDILAVPGIQLSEDDNVLLQGIEANPNAIGYFGYAYYAAEGDALRAVAIDGVAPSPETVDDYGLTRPLFIYTSANILAEKPQVAAFVNFYLQAAADIAEQTGYVPATRQNARLDAAVFLAASAAAAQ